MLSLISCTRYLDKTHLLHMLTYFLLKILLLLFHLASSFPSWLMERDGISAAATSSLLIRKCLLVMLLLQYKIINCAAALAARFLASRLEQRRSHDGPAPGGCWYWAGGAGWWWGSWTYRLTHTCPPWHSNFSLAFSRNYSRNFERSSEFKSVMVGNISALLSSLEQLLTFLAHNTGAVKILQPLQILYLLCEPNMTFKVAVVCCNYLQQLYLWFAGRP